MTSTRWCRQIPFDDDCQQYEVHMSKPGHRQRNLDEHVKECGWTIEDETETTCEGSLSSSTIALDCPASDITEDLSSHQTRLRQDFKAASNAESSPSPLECRGSSPEKPRPRAVSFSTIDLHMHSPILGDNPSCLLGPPMALGHRCHSISLPLEEYEVARSPQRRGSFVLSRLEREELLRAEGYCRSDFTRAQLEIREIQVSRDRLRKQARNSRVATCLGPANRFARAFKRLSSRAFKRSSGDGNQPSTLPGTGKH